RLEKTPHDLAKLDHRSVHLILVESYGQTVLERPFYVQELAATFDRFERTLGARGFQIVSSVLDSPTYGGRSWLAHATLATGVNTGNDLDYEILSAKKPRTLASFFRDAGYLTVLAQPGTTRPWPNGDYLGFERKYYAWNFDYAGPSYAWATMPDQYVLDFIRRRELEHPARPLFAQYVLVTSHAPWSDQPEIVPDWSKLENGAIFRQMPSVHYPITWPKFANASEAYARSLRYDFDVLAHFIAHAIADGSLVIILGDHQPVSDITDGATSHGVPVHVLSRDPALLAPFIARGYTPGLRVHRPGSHPGLDTFLSSLLADFSTNVKQ
ncbi:MAG TPA: sulfatase-like hydrolase/transferase, partial [Polyangiaceae bacterium]